MSWLIYSLLTVLLWGIGQVLIKRGLSNISSLWSIVISATINALIYIPFALITHAEFSVAPQFFFFIFMIAVLNMLFFYAIEKGQLAFSGTIFAAYPITTIILSAIFLRENLSFFQYGMIALVLSGGGILGYSASNSGQKTKLFGGWLFWAILGSVGVGTADFLAKVTIQNVGVSTYNLFFPIAYFIGLAGYWLVDKPGRKLSAKIHPKQFMWSVGGVVLLTIGMLSFNYALEHGNVSLVTTISSSYAALTVLLAHIFLQEKVNKKQLLGISCILVGIIFIGF